MPLYAPNRRKGTARAAVGELHSRDSSSSWKHKLVGTLNCSFEELLGVEDQLVGGREE